MQDSAGKQHVVRRAGSVLLLAAWLAGAIVMLLPAYHGEFIAPGSATTLHGLQIAVIGFVFGFTQLELLLMATLPITLFLLTPLILLRYLRREYVLPAIWGSLLAISAVSPVIAALAPLHGVNQRLFGFYLLPLPLLIAGAALYTLGYAGLLASRQDRRATRQLCIHCGYDLRGTPTGVCPECGQANDVRGDELN